MTRLKDPRRWYPVVALEDAEVLEYGEEGQIQDSNMAKVILGPRSIDQIRVALGLPKPQGADDGSE